MNAPHAAQRRLLDVAELDARIRQAEAAKRNPPQAARVQELLAQRQQQTQELKVLLSERDDAKVEISRIESDVKVVDARANRDAERLNSTSSVKDAQGLEHEIASLARRKSELEDAELIVMERLEDVEGRIAAQETLIAETTAEGGQLSADAKAHVAAAVDRIEAGGRDRAAIIATLPEDLVTRYERIAERGVGAALLRAQTCEGCRMVLSGSDLQVIRQADSDTLVTCPQCSCLLVRTEESGL